MQINELKLPPQTKKASYTITQQGNITLVKVEPKKRQKSFSQHIKKQEGCKIELGQLNSIKLTQNPRFRGMLKDNPFVCIQTPPSSNFEPKRKLKCNCKKSKCLKLYCDCFANQLVCGKDCECLNCFNTELNSKRLELLEQMTTKRAEAKGCKCTKSNCQKKYCDCFNRGIPCGQHCSCENCENGEIKHQHHSP